MNLVGRSPTHIRVAAKLQGERIFSSCSHEALVMSAPGRLCCKSLKTPGDKFPARSRNKPRSLIDVASGSLPKSPVSLSPGDEVPHMFTRKPRLQLEKFAINGAKRLLQQNRHIAAPDECDGTSAVGESRHRIPGASVGQPAIAGCRKKTFSELHRQIFRRSSAAAATSRAGHH